MTRMGASFVDVRQMPVRYRHWFIKRIAKTLAASNTTKTGSIEVDDDTPISQVLGKKNT